MNLTQFAKIAPNLLATGHSAHLISVPGLGKSESVRQIAKEHNRAVVEFHLTSVDSPDVRGYLLPFKVTLPDGSIELHSRFTTSPMIEAVLQIVKDTGLAEGILFLDERAQASLDVQKAVAPLILDRKIGEHSLPGGWVVWSASNRSQDRAGVNREPMHLINREARFYIEPDVGSFVTWAELNDIHYLFTGFAQFKPGLVFSDEVPSEPKPFMTPRSLVKLHEACVQYTGGSITASIGEDPLINLLAAAYVGQGGAAELFNFCKVDSQLPKFDEIIADPANCKVPTAPDVSYALVGMIAHHVNQDNVDPVFDYMMRMSPEFQASAVRAVMRRSGNKIALTSKFSSWVTDNATLLAGSFL